MNADEIRNKRERFSERISGSMTCEPNEKDMFRYQGDMIRETAAQLAEINEHLAKIANPLMVVDTESKSLRDEFAMAVLMAIISQGTMNSDMDVVPYVQDAYTIADAMLAARKK